MRMNNKIMTTTMIMNLTKALQLTETLPLKLMSKKCFPIKRNKSINIEKTSKANRKKNLYTSKKIHPIKKNIQMNARNKRNNVQKKIKRKKQARRRKIKNKMLLISPTKKCCLKLKNCLLTE